MTEKETTTNYWDYLHLDKLLSLQDGLEGDESQLMPDELHFIVVHQAFELWFKLVLRELRLARDHLAQPEVPETAIPHVVHHLRRVNRILELAADQFKVMETLTPQDFLAFRDKLVPASGFQSFQMRELEILLGLEDAQRIKYGKVDPLSHVRELAAVSPTGAMVVARIERARSEESLRTALLRWLYRTPIQGSRHADAGDDAAVLGFIDQYLARIAEVHETQSARLQRAHGTDPEQVAGRFALATEQARAFLHAEDVPEDERRVARRTRAGLLYIESYRELPLLAWPRTLVDTVVELEELMVIWRSRHVRMVERIIGRRVGTGGSSGVDYLEKTTKLRIFHELWTVRTVLLPQRDRPALVGAASYDFVR